MCPVLLVAGGSRGIGASTAALAAERGYDVGISYHRRADAAAEVAARCRSAGRAATARRADVSVEDDVVGLFAAVEQELGPVDGVVVSAGIVAPQGRLDNFGAQRLRRVLEVNVLGSLLCAREAVRRMSTGHGGRGGSIVLLSSAASRLGSPGEYVDYAASKGAVDAMTVGLAREVAGEGIRVNAVRAGIVRTGIHAEGGEPGRAERLGPSVPMGRAGDPHEVAHAILWLLSGEASYVSGAIVDVAGGR
jgi:NAD(P)-dependent dehydrogenase (short-subunit alcohol dehydrogenase family)